MSKLNQTNTTVAGLWAGLYSTCASSHPQLVDPWAQHFLQLNPLSPSRIVRLNQWENNTKALKHFLSDFAGERFCQSKPGDLPAETDLADKPILRLRRSMKNIPYHGLQRPSFNEF